MLNRSKQVLSVSKKTLLMKPEGSVSVSVLHLDINQQTCLMALKEEMEIVIYYVRKSKKGGISDCIFLHTSQSELLALCLPIKPHAADKRNNQTEQNAFSRLLL